MSFLNFNPAVYVIGEEYEICVSVEAFGLVTVKIGEQVFYEDHSGGSVCRGNSGKDPGHRQKGYGPRPVGEPDSGPDPVEIPRGIDLGM